jgi:putative transposase
MTLVMPLNEGPPESSPRREPWDRKSLECPKPREGRQTMAHSFSNLLTHVIFSTQGRQPSLTPDLRPDLLAYMGGIVRNLRGKLIEASAPLDHVHCLLSLPATLAVADALRVLKTNSSLWVHEIRRRPHFRWQTGYGAFSVSQSNVPAVLKYIRHQEEHHRKISFQEEFIAFLKRNGIVYDERYIWE